MVRILKKTIAQNQKNWDSQLKSALWDNRVTTKRSTAKSPFELVYGTLALFPTQLVMLVEKLIYDAKEEPNHLTRRINQLVELQENKEKVTQNLIKYQDKMKILFEKRLRTEFFNQVTLYSDEMSGERTKVNMENLILWFGPFKIVEVKGNNTFLLENLDGEAFELPVNG